MIKRQIFAYLSKSIGSDIATRLFMLTFCPFLHLSILGGSLGMSKIAKSLIGLKINKYIILITSMQMFIFFFFFFFLGYFLRN